jgi:hypothetical protein
MCLFTLKITHPKAHNGAADSPPAGQPLANWLAGRVHPLISQRLASGCSPPRR